MLQSRAKRVETLCFSVSDIVVFFYPPPHFNVVAATKSIRQSDILNIEKGEGESIGCNAISLKTNAKAQIIANFWWVSQPFCTGLFIKVDYVLYQRGNSGSFTDLLHHFLVLLAMASVTRKADCSIPKRSEVVDSGQRITAWCARALTRSTRIDDLFWNVSVSWSRRAGSHAHSVSLRLSFTLNCSPVR